MKLNEDIVFGFEKLSDKELMEAFYSAKDDFVSFADRKFVETYASKLSANACFAVGRCSGVISSIIAFYANIPPAIFISHVHTRKEFRKKGYFNHLLEMIVECEDFKTFNSIRLEVRKDNPQAISAYIKKGFQIISESETKYTMERLK